MVAIGSWTRRPETVGHVVRHADHMTKLPAMPRMRTYVRNINLRNVNLGNVKFGNSEIGNVILEINLVHPVWNGPSRPPYPTARQAHSEQSTWASQMTLVLDMEL